MSMEAFVCYSSADVFIDPRKIGVENFDTLKKYLAILIIYKLWLWLEWRQLLLTVYPFEKKRKSS